MRIDPSQVDQILMNLVVNARDAMPSGGKLTIETTNVRIDESYCRQHVGFRAGDYVLLAVSDTASGWTGETLAHVFEPFFTTKAVGKGTGLGLATVHGIVTQNGGVVSVYSEPGLGHDVQDLPAPDARGALRRGRERGGSAASSRTGGTVLAGGGRRGGPPDARRDAGCPRLRRARRGGVARGAEPGRTGRTLSIDLLLTDVVMPELSGKELCERLRVLRPRLPVLYMSGYTADVIAHHGILEDGVQFIQKPFTMDDLARAIRKALRPEA